MITTICLVRHGQTDWNKQHLIQGRANTNLNDEGIAQAHITADILLNNDKNWDKIYSSPLNRAYQTASIIKDTLNFKDDIIIENDLIEREFGVSEQQQITKELFDLINQDKIEGLETREQLGKRTLNILLSIAKQNEGKRILIVTHSHYIKGILSTLIPNYNFYSLLKNASLNYFYVEDNAIIKYDLNVEYKQGQD